MNILVTGGAGFIGSHVVRRCLKEGHRVRVLDNFSTGHRHNLEEVSASIEILEGSITDMDTCRRACHEVEIIFHLAAIPSVPRSIDEPIAAHEANGTGTLYLLEAARLQGARRFVYSASSSVYGDTPTLPKMETMFPHPQSPYACQKYLGELYCSNYFHIHGLETVSLRYFNIFGPRQDPHSPYGAVIPKFITALMEKTAPTIFGDGEQSRDFTYVDNAVQANLLAAQAPKNALGRVYNVACGGRFSLNTLLAQLQKILGTNLAAQLEPTRQGDVKHSEADITAAQKELGYAVLVPFEEGLQKTVSWYQGSL